MTDSIPILTIDGPSGSGKGTIARRVADHLGWHLLDSGALYRLVALAGQRKDLAPADQAAHERVAEQLDVRFGLAADGGEQIWLEGEEVSRAIRTEQAGEGASRVGAMPGVRCGPIRASACIRTALPAWWRTAATWELWFFPPRALKIYLTASAEERARRRYNQLKDKGLDANLAALSLDIAERDRRDASRPIAPLKPADDALIVDSTSMTIDAVLARVLELAAARFGRG